MPSFPAGGLIEAAGRILGAVGAPEDSAQKLAGWLVNANLSGHPSHGIMRIPEYVEHIRAGRWAPAERPRLIVETETTVLIDGRMGFGHLAAEALTRSVAAKAKAQRVAIGGAIRAGHTGRLGEWSELAADLGVMFFMCAGCAAVKLAAPFGGAEGRLDTHPITFATPAADGDRMTLDFATTACAEGKIRVYRDRGEELPPGWILDREGNPSTDPNDLYAGGWMLPFGAHKGYGLSVMVSILASNLVAAVSPDSSDAPAAFALALDPSAFGDGDAVLRAVRRNLERLRATRPAPGHSEVLVPGDPERRARAAGRDAPVRLPDATWDAVLETAALVGLEPAAVTRVAAGR